MINLTTSADVRLVDGRIRLGVHVLDGATMTVHDEWFDIDPFALELASLLLARVVEKHNIEEDEG
jgi:hypothetical protein